MPQLVKTQANKDGREVVDRLRVQQPSVLKSILTPHGVPHHLRQLELVDKLPLRLYEEFALALGASPCTDSTGTKPTLFPALEVLALSGSSCGDAAILALLPALTHHPKLAVLQVSSCCLSDAAGLRLAALIKAQTATAGQQAWASTLRQGGTDSLGTPRRSSSGAGHWPRRQAAGLQEDWTGPQGAADSAGQAEHTAAAAGGGKTLDGQTCFIGLAGYGLQVVDLSRNQLTGATLSALAAALADEHCCVRRLNLSFNPQLPTAAQAAALLQAALRAEPPAHRVTVELLQAATPAATALAAPRAAAAAALALGKRHSTRSSSRGSGGGSGIKPGVLRSMSGGGASCSGSGGRKAGAAVCAPTDAGLHLHAGVFVWEGSSSSAADTALVATQKQLLLQPGQQVCHLSRRAAHSSSQHSQASGDRRWARSVGQVVAVAASAAGTATRSAADQAAEGTIAVGQMQRPPSVAGAAMAQPSASAVAGGRPTRADEAVKVACTAVDVHQSGLVWQNSQAGQWIALAKCGLEQQQQQQQQQLLAPDQASSRYQQKRSHCQHPYNLEQVPQACLTATCHAVTVRSSTQTQQQQQQQRDDHHWQTSDDLDADDSDEDLLEAWAQGQTQQQMRLPLVQLCGPQQLDLSRHLKRYQQWHQQQRTKQQGLARSACAGREQGGPASIGQQQGLHASAGQQDGAGATVTETCCTLGSNQHAQPAAESHDHVCCMARSSGSGLADCADCGRHLQAAARPAVAAAAAGGVTAAGCTAGGDVLPELDSSRLHGWQQQQQHGLHDHAQGVQKHPGQQQLASPGGLQQQKVSDDKSGTVGRAPEPVVTSKVKHHKRASKGWQHKQQHKQVPEQQQQQQQQEQAQALLWEQQKHGQGGQHLVLHVSGQRDLLAGGMQGAVLPDDLIQLARSVCVLTDSVAQLEWLFYDSL